MGMLCIPLVNNAYFLYSVYISVTAILCSLLVPVGTYQDEITIERKAVGT